MALSWTEACAKVGYSLSEKPPVAEYEFYGYDKGKAFGPFNTEAETRKYPYREKVAKNAESKTNFYIRQRKLEAKAVEQFVLGLRAEYPEVSNAIYNLCYTKAYESGHSAGYDEIAIYLQDYVEFAVKIIDLAKSEETQ